MDLVEIFASCNMAWRAAIGCLWSVETQYLQVPHVLGSAFDHPKEIPYDKQLKGILSAFPFFVLSDGLSDSH